MFYFSIKTGVYLKYINAKTPFLAQFYKIVQEKGVFKM